jgi:hypothetical protein
MQRVGLRSREQGPGPPVLRAPGAPLDLRTTDVEGSNIIIHEKPPNPESSPPPTSKHTTATLEQGRDQR